MNIESICRRDLVTVDRSQTLQQAAALMREHHVGALVVTGQTPGGSEVIGVVTDRDLVVEALARGLEGSTAVGQVAGGRLVSIPGAAAIDDAIVAMQTEGVRRLLVVTPEGGLVGIVSLDDLLEAMAGEMVGLARAIRAGMIREATERGPMPSQEVGGPRLRMKDWPARPN